MPTVRCPLCLTPATVDYGRTAVCSCGTHVSAPDAPPRGSSGRVRTYVIAAVALLLAFGLAAVAAVVGVRAIVAVMRSGQRPKDAEAPDDGPKELAGTKWRLEDDRSGGLVFAKEGDRRQMGITSQHGRKMVVMEYVEVEPGRLKATTINDPASAAPPGVEHEFRYEFRGKKLIVWHQGEQMVYVPYDRR